MIITDHAVIIGILPVDNNSLNTSRAQLGRDHKRPPSCLQYNITYLADILWCECGFGTARSTYGTGLMGSESDLTSPNSNIFTQCDGVNGTIDNRRHDELLFMWKFNTPFEC